MHAFHFYIDNISFSHLEIPTDILLQVADEDKAAIEILQKLTERVIADSLNQLASTVEGVEMFGIPCQFTRNNNSISLMFLDQMIQIYSDGHQFRVDSLYGPECTLLFFMSVNLVDFDNNESIEVLRGNFIIILRQFMTCCLQKALIKCCSNVVRLCPSRLEALRPDAFQVAFEDFPRHFLISQISTDAVKCSIKSFVISSSGVLEEEHEIASFFKSEYIDSL